MKCRNEGGIQQHDQSQYRNPGRQQSSTMNFSKSCKPKRPLRGWSSKSRCSRQAHRTCNGTGQAVCNGCSLLTWRRAAWRWLVGGIRAKMSMALRCIWCTNAKVSEQTLWATDLHSYSVKVKEPSDDILISIQPRSSQTAIETKSSAFTLPIETNIPSDSYSGLNLTEKQKGSKE